MEQVRAHDINLAVERVGTGVPPIVVIPQWFLSSKSLRGSALVRSLAAHHEIILYDRRGTGESDKPGPPYTAARDARDLIAMLDALGVGDAALLGHGVRGSQVALNVGGHVPDRIAALVCLGGTPRLAAGPEWPYGIDDAAWRVAFGVLDESYDPPPGASIAMGDDWAAAGPVAARDILERTRDEDMRSFLPKITPPTLVIHMRGDTLVPFDAARWLAESLPNGVLEEFDAPREIPFRAHAELAEHIEEFLRVSARGGPAAR